MFDEELYWDQVRFFSRSSSDGDAVQKRLAETRLLAFGAGRVGAYALTALAEAGLGSLLICDDTETGERDSSSTSPPAQGAAPTTRAAALTQRLNSHMHADDLCEHRPLAEADEEELTKLLRRSHVAVVCLDAPDPVLVENINRAALRAEVSCVIGQVYDGVGWVGPTIVPNSGPCYQCFESRRNMNLDNYEESMRYETRFREMRALRKGAVAPRPLAACVGALVALEALRLLTKLAAPQTLGRVLRVDFHALEMTYHRVLRWPRCPACHDEARSSQPTVDA